MSATVQVDREALAYALAVVRAERPVPACWCGKPSTRGEERGGGWVVNGGCDAHGAGPPLRRVAMVAALARVLGERL